MRKRIALGAAMFFGFAALAVAARADEEEIALDKVPKAVMDSARQKFPGAKIHEAARETEDGKTIYELEMTHEARRMDVSFQEDGTLVLVETAVPEPEAPAAVIRAVKAKYPGAKINRVESVKKGPRVKAEVDFYELHLTAAGKKTVEVEVDPRGKILHTEEGGDDKD